MTERVDVAVLGGALAGSATALLLRRRHPGLRVMIIERSPRFDRKVGESTVEISSYFLTRVLRLTDHLAREHLPKQGLRYWFHNGRVRTLRDASEVGASQSSRFPTYQVDRAVLDEHVLGLAVEAGALLRRPAKVTEVRLPDEEGGGPGLVRIESEDGDQEIRAGWIIDASGRSAVVARRRDWLHPIDDHPISATWSRFRGVKDLDGLEVAGNDPDSPFARATTTSRRLATNHFNGWGYWIWFIPLRGGETSIGAVWDRRLVSPDGRGGAERLRWFLESNPLTAELTADAEPLPDDDRSFVHLPYTVDRVAGRGWALVGDAAGFLDPFYSPGLDQLAFSVSWAAELVGRSLDPDWKDEADAALEDHNRRYAKYFEGLHRAVYRDKYPLMGDYDTLSAAFLMDTALYYFFALLPVVRASRRLLTPPFYIDYSEVAARFMRFYQDRLATIARRKLALGVYGNRNAGRRPRLPGFSLGWDSVRMLARGVALWIRAEAEHAWTFISRPRPLRGGMPVAPAARKAPAPGEGRPPGSPWSLTS